MSYREPSSELAGGFRKANVRRGRRPVLPWGVSLVGTARCPNDNAGVHAGNLVLWTTVGCLLLVLAFMINDCLLLRSISNTRSVGMSISLA